MLIVAIGFLGVFIGFAMTDTFAYREEIEQYQRFELKGGDSKAVQEKLLELQTP